MASLSVKIRNSKINETNKNYLIKFLRQEIRINGVCCKTYCKNADALQIKKEYGIIKKASLEFVELVGIKFDGEEVILSQK